MKKNTFLLPRGFRLPGFIFLLAGIIIGVLRFHFRVKPELLSLNVFAFYSSFLESKYMEIIRNNMGEELTMLFILLGLFLIAFSKDRLETEINNTVRLKAFFLMMWSNIIFLLACIFFTFGFAFLYMLIAYMGFGLVSYIVSYRILISLERKKKISKEEFDR